MKKKKFALMGIALLAGLTLASCTNDQPTAESKKVTPSTESTKVTPATESTKVTPATESTKVTPATESTKVTPATDSTKVTPTSTTPEVETSRLDISVTYSTTEGITLQKKDSWSNIVDGKTYTRGDLLPTWTRFGKAVGCTIYDAASYSTKDNDTYTAVKEKGFTSETDSTQMIDLLFFKTGKINSAGKNGEMEDLNAYIDAGKMPNFKAWLDENPAIKKQLTQANGAIYYTPYFDGYNDVERMFNMDTKIVATLLDSDNTVGDTATTNGGSAPSANVVQNASYTPFINATKNYATEDLTIDVVGADNKAAKITLAQADNIISQQNTLIAAGCTGKELLDNFKSYLTTVFGEYVGEGKLYANLSEIFTSAHAAYNVDELIALMRVVKANPGVITGDENAEVECLFPRGKTNNRIDNIMDFAAVWGVQGLTAEKDMLYFAADKTLSDAATTKATYDSLTYLGQIYSEGLILGEFWVAPQSGKGSTEYLDKYWKKTTADAGYGLLMYDYSATQSAGNDLVDGIGTAAEKRTIEYQSTGIMPILPPITYWATDESWTRNDDITDFTHKKLMRYSEENRALKDSSWAVPTVSDNKEKAIELMDYLFSTEGALIQDFGPEEYWAGYDAATGDYTKANLVDGEELDPMCSANTLTMLASSGYDFWTFMRDIIGATHGIGSVRSKTLQIVACNKYSQAGAANLALGISTGVVTQGLVVDTYDWGVTVPTTYENTVADTAAVAYENLTNFWKSDKCGNPNGWVAVIVAVADGTFTTDLEVCTNTAGDHFTFAQITSAEVWAAKDTLYLYTLASSLGDQYTPSYAKSAK